MNLSRLPSILLGSTLALLAACSKGHSDKDGHDHAQGSANAHGAAGAVPGSYEDWCGEHSVPESKCTRCDPKLASAFKATGDWCGEHGLPESQCVQCDPSRRMTRPLQK